MERRSPRLHRLTILRISTTSASGNCFSSRSGECIKIRQSMSLRAVLWRSNLLFDGKPLPRRFVHFGGDCFAGAITLLAMTHALLSQKRSPGPLQSGRPFYLCTCLPIHLRIHPPDRPREGNCLTDVLNTADPGRDALRPYTEILPILAFI